MSQAIFVGASQYLIDPLTNKLKQTRISGPEVRLLLDILEINVQ